MRPLLLAFALLLAAIPRIRGQDLPACASSCAINGVGATGCLATDGHCICTSDKFLSYMTTCVTQACNIDDQKLAYAFAQAFCDNAHVTLKLPTPGATTPPPVPTTTPVSVVTTTKTGNGTEATGVSPEIFKGRAASSRDIGGIKGGYVGLIVAIGMIVAWEF